MNCRKLIIGIVVLLPTLALTTSCIGLSRGIEKLITDRIEAQISADFDEVEAELDKLEREYEEFLNDMPNATIAENSNSMPTVEESYNTGNSYYDSSVNTSSNSPVFEGELVMYVLGPESLERVYEWVETDWYNQTLIYVLQLNSSIRIADYVSAEAMQFCPESSGFTNELLIKMSNGNSLSNYANRRVRIRGKMDIAAGGWRNYKGIYLEAESIELK